MKIIVLKDNLKKSLSVVERATGSGAMLPILKNVLLKTEDGRIKLAATDLEFSAVSWLNGKIVEEGGITVPAQVISQLLANISVAKLELETNGDKLTVKTEFSENVIQGLKEDDFPIIPIVETENYLEIKSAELKKALNQTESAAATADSRPEMNGILFHLSGGKLKLAATNSFRLAEKILKANSFKTNIEEFRVVVPLKAAKEVSKLAEEQSSAKIIIDSHQILFDFGDSAIISRLVEGNFPEYSDKIPVNHLASVTINKDEFSGAVKLASVFVGKVNDIKIKSNPDGLEISSVNAGIGENKSLLKAKISGEDQELVLNWRYLLDGLKGIEDDEIELGLNGEASPVFIHGLKDDSYFCIVMPIKSGYG